MNLILMSLLTCCLQQAEEKPDLRGPGFGRSMICLTDHDGDSISELLIADGANDLPGSKADGLFVYSPGKKKHLRIIDHGLRVSDGQYILARLKYVPGPTPDFVYYGEVMEDNVPTGYLVVASSRTGREFSRIRYDPPTWNAEGPRVVVLGDVDGEPGEEVLLINQAGGTSEAGERWPIDGSIFSLAKGERIRHFGAWAIEPIDDVDHDGVLDYVQTTAGSCAVHSGKTGLALFELSARGSDEQVADSTEHFGVGDLNSDGVNDIVRLVVFEKEEQVLRNMWTLSGKDGKTLWRRNNLLDAGARAPVFSMPDRNGDGAPEVVVLTIPSVEKWEGYPGWEMYSGRSGESLGHHRWGADFPKGDYEAGPSYMVVFLDDGEDKGRAGFAVSRTNASGAIYCANGTIEIVSDARGVSHKFSRWDFGPTPESD